MIFKQYVKSKQQLEDLKTLLLEEFKKRLNNKDEELIKLIDFASLSKIKEEENLEWLYYNFIKVIDSDIKNPLQTINNLSNDLLEQILVDTTDIKITKYSGRLAKSYLGFKYKNCLKKNNMNIFGSFFLVVHLKTSLYKNKILCSGDSLSINDINEKDILMQCYYIHDNSALSSDSFLALEQQLINNGVISETHNKIIQEHERWKFRNNEEQEKKLLKELENKYNLRKKILGF